MASILTKISELQHGRDYDIYKADEEPLMHASRRSIDHTTGDGTIDYHGYPASKSKTGGFWTEIRILGCQTGIVSAYFGISYNLVLYTTKVLHQDSATSTSLANVWSGLSNISCILAALIANGFLGDCVTSLLLCALTFFGTLLITLSAAFPSIRSAPCVNERSACPGVSIGRLLAFNIPLWVTAIGFGLQPCTLAFGADQYDETDEQESRKKRTYFSRYYSCVCLSAFIAGFGFVNVEEKIGFGLGFGLITAVIGLSLLVLCSGTPYYRYHRSKYNTSRGVSSLFQWVFSDRNVKITEYSGMLDHENDLYKSKQLFWSNAHSEGCR